MVKEFLKFTWVDKVNRYSLLFMLLLIVFLSLTGCSDRDTIISSCEDNGYTNCNEYYQQLKSDIAEYNKDD